MKLKKMLRKKERTLKKHIISTLSKTNITFKLYINCDKPEKKLIFKII